MSKSKKGKPSRRAISKVEASALGHPSTAGSSNTEAAPSHVTLTQANYIHFIADNDITALQLAATLPEDLRSFAIRHTQEEAQHRRQLENTKEEHDFALSMKYRNYVFWTDVLGKVFGIIVAGFLIYVLYGAIMQGNIPATVLSSIFAAAALYKLFARNSSAGK